MHEAFDTPVLLIIFNRPETAKKVFDSIRMVKPKKLFVAADGPRMNKTGERELCNKTREIVESVDWECDVKTLFREENLGCGRGPFEAISWFFENVEQGIILEDDCLPNYSFFFFCQELLNRYKNYDKVYQISGTNPIPESYNQNSFLFSRYGGIWGWATWRRAWKNYDFEMLSWKKLENQRKISKSLSKGYERNYYTDRFNATFFGSNVTWWDYQWFYCRLINNGLSIIPVKNLIKNIGFNENATHTFDSNSFLANLRTDDLIWPLKLPSSISEDLHFNKQYRDVFYPKQSYIKKLTAQLFKVVKLLIYKKQIS